MWTAPLVDNMVTVKPWGKESVNSTPGDWFEFIGILKNEKIHDKQVFSAVEKKLLKGLTPVAEFPGRMILSDVLSVKKLFYDR